MMNMQGQATAGVSTIGQAAVTAALEGPQDLIESHRPTTRTGATSWSAGCARPRASPATSPRARSTSSPTSPAASARPRPRAEEARDRHRLRHGAARGAPRRDRAGHGLRHEPLLPHLLCNRPREPARGLQAHPGVLRRPALNRLGAGRRLPHNAPQGRDSEGPEHRFAGADLLAGATLAGLLAGNPRAGASRASPSSRNGRRAATAPRSAAWASGSSRKAASGSTAPRRASPPRC